MKRLAMIFAVTLILGIALAVIGGVVISKASIGTGDIYEIFEDNIPFSDDNSAFVRAENVDLDSMKNVTNLRVVSYPLNEFNTVQIMADSCMLNIEPLYSDELVVRVETPNDEQDPVSLQTAVKDGCLYIKCFMNDNSRLKNKEVKLTVAIPESYKGGYCINAAQSIINTGNLESSMDIDFNLYECDFKAENISAKEIIFSVSGCDGTADSITSGEGIKLTTVSSNLNFSKLSAVYTILTSNSTTLRVDNMLSGLTANMTTTSADLDYSSVDSNITINAAQSDVNLVIPKNSPVSFRHSAMYSKVDNKVNWTGGDDKNENSRYVIDVNIDFGIVSLAEKE